MNVKSFKNKRENKLILIFLTLFFKFFIVSNFSNIPLMKFILFFSEKILNYYFAQFFMDPSLCLYTKLNRWKFGDLH